MEGVISINRLDSKGMMSLGVVLIISGFCYTAPAKLTAYFPAGAYVWVGLTAVSVGLACLLADKLLGGKSLCQGAEIAFGKGVGKAVCVGFGFFSFLYASLHLGEFSRAVEAFLLPASPRIFVLVIGAILGLVLCIVGIEPMARYAFVICIGAFVMVSVIFVVTLSDAEPGNLFPLISKPSLSGIGICLRVYTGVLFCLFVPGISPDAKSKTSFKATLIAGLFMTLIMLFYNLCIPYPASLKYAYPLHRLSLLANSTLLFQRLDIIVYALWMFLSFLTFGASALFACNMISRGLGLKNPKAIAPAVVFLCFLVCMYNLDLEDMLTAVSVLLAFVIFPVVVFCYRIVVGRVKDK